MKHPQVLNVKASDSLKDRSIAIDGNDVIRNDNQVLMSLTETTITVDIAIYNLTLGLHQGTATSKIMTYQIPTDIWTIDVADITPLLSGYERQKFIAKVTQSGGSPVMRSFKLQDFIVDADAFENVLIRLPYQIIIGTPSKIRWYATMWATPLYEAEVYEGGAGSTAATDPSRVTHRGPIVAI